MPSKARMSICGFSIPRGHYTFTRRFKAITVISTCFGSTTIPADSLIEFFETRNFGFLKWLDANSKWHLVKE